MDSSASSSGPPWIRYALAAVAAVGVIAALRFLPLGGAVESLKAWVAGLGVWGPAAFVGIYVAATVLLVPGTILTLVAGAVFGWLVGVVAVSVGSTAGAAAAFLIARYFARQRVARLAQGRRVFAAVDAAVAEGGWKVVALLRLSPAIPFNLQNYLFGVTPIKFWPYVLASWLAMLPATVLYVYLGHVAGTAAGPADDRSTAQWSMLAVGLVATIVVTIYLTRLARRKLEEMSPRFSESPNLSKV